MGTHIFVVNDKSLSKCIILNMMEQKFCPSISFIFQNMKEIWVSKKKSFLKFQTKRNFVRFRLPWPRKMNQIIKKTNSPKDWCISNSTHNFRLLNSVIFEFIFVLLFHFAWGPNRTMKTQTLTYHRQHSFAKWTIVVEVLGSITSLSNNPRHLYLIRNGGVTFKGTNWCL